MSFLTRLTRRKIQKSWDCDSQELRLVLRLPRGYRFTGMQVGCSRVTVEYFHLEAPDNVLCDCLDLQLPVRGEEAVHALREEGGEEVLNLWVPRHQATMPGYEPIASPSFAGGRAVMGQVAS